MVQGQVFSKGQRGLTLFLFHFFKVYHLRLEITLPFAKLCYAFEKKKIFLSP